MQFSSRAAESGVDFLSHTAVVVVVVNGDVSPKQGCPCVSQMLLVNDHVMQRGLDGDKDPSFSTVSFNMQESQENFKTGEF